jgi:uncharacterized membrane protein (UPF0182 family)
MAETLEDGLGLLFGGTLPTRGTLAAADSTTGATTGAATTGPSTTAGGSTVPADVLRQAQEHYDRAIAAQRAGDWAAYGREIDQLGAVLKQLRPGGRKP